MMYAMTVVGLAFELTECKRLHYVLDWDLVGVCVWSEVLS